MGIAALTIFWREIRGLIRLRRVAIGAGAFLLGSLPLWTYNARFDWATFHEISGVTSAESGVRPHEGASGDPERTGLIRIAWPTRTRRLLCPTGHPVPLEGASARIAAMSIDPRHNLGLYALATALLAIPLAGSNATAAACFSPSHRYDCRLAADGDHGECRRLRTPHHSSCGRSHN